MSLETAAPAAPGNSSGIDRLHPSPHQNASDEQLLEWYAAGTGPGNGAPWVRFNFVSSLDGAATHNGRSGKLGDAGDKRIFALLRRLADVILVGAGTVRVEGYAGELVSAEDQAWRTGRGLPAHPAFAVVSGDLDLDPDSELFAQAPVRPIIYTTEQADAGRRARLEKLADVVVAGGRFVDIPALVADLSGRGLGQILSEGGPHLFGSFQQARCVDELCLSLSPLLVGGSNLRIAVTPEEDGLDSLELVQVLRSGSSLYLRYAGQPSS